MNRRMVVHLLIIFSLWSCKQSPKNDYRKVEFRELITLINEGKINQFKLSYKDSLGNDLTPELKKRMNQGLMFRDFYANKENEITQIRLKEYSHENVFEEIQIRELLNNPLQGFNYMDVNCDKIDSILAVVLMKDQGVRNGEPANIYTTDISNQQIVISLIENCGWPENKESIKSIWFVIQHSDSKYMAKYYQKFKQLESKGLLESSDMALMEDRILMNNGYPQIYGSQVVGQSVYKLRDHAKVNEWRAQVGLGTIEENTRRFGFEFDRSDYLKVEENPIQDK